MGIISARQKNYSEAETQLRKIIEVQPKSFNVIWDLAKLYTIQNRNAEAIELYKKILTFDKNNKYVLFECAMLLAKNGNIDEAKIRLTEAIKLDPAFHDAITALQSLP